MTALRNPFHLLAAQPLSGYLFGPVIADRKQLCQHAQRTLPAIIGRQQLATKIIRIGLRHISCREVQSYYSVHLIEKCSSAATFDGQHIGRKPLKLDHDAIQHDRIQGRSLREIAKGHRISMATEQRALRKNPVQAA